jgi:hypothetical protein
VQVAIGIYEIGGYRVVAVEHVVRGTGGGTGLHQLVAGAAHVPDIEVGSGKLAVTLPLHIDAQYLCRDLVDGEVEVVRCHLVVPTDSYVSGIV